MYKTEYSKVVAAISISLLLASVLSNPIHSVLADSSKEAIAKQKQLSEERAKEYLKQLGAELRTDITKPNYGQFNATTTKSSDRDIKTELQNAEKAAEEKSKQYLKQIGQETRKDLTKPNYGQFNVTTTAEVGKDRKAEIEKAKQESEQKAKETLEKLYPKLAQKNYGS